MILPLGAGLAVVAGTFLARRAGSVCAVVAIDARTGERCWLAEGLAANESLGLIGFNSPATPTPVVVGDLVVAYFGGQGAFACRRDTGAIAWSQRELPYRSQYGVASSLARAGSLIVVQSDSEGIPSFVTGLSSQNGRPAWTVSRDGRPTWRSPMVLEMAGRALVCVWGDDECEFLAAETGEVLGRLAGIELSAGDPVASPVVEGGRLLLAGTERLVSVDLGRVLASPTNRFRLDLGSADLENPVPGAIPQRPEFVAELKGRGPICTTPAVNREWMATISDDGTVTGIRREKGGVHWQTAIGETRSSPVLAGEVLHAVNGAGRVYSFDLSGPEPLPLPEVDLGESVFASPAVSEGGLFVRTTTRLFCLRGTR